jgi:hypothetical protein
MKFSLYTKSSYIDKAIIVRHSMDVLGFDTAVATLLAVK